jgi:hypothetical protein
VVKNIGGRRHESSEDDPVAVDRLGHRVFQSGVRKAVTAQGSESTTG